MKKYTFLSRTLLFSLFALLVTACAKDKGFYNEKLDVQPFSGNTYEYLEQHKGVFDSLLLVVNRTGMADTLKQGNVTLFAPTNASFQLAINNLNALRRLSNRQPLNLSNIDFIQLDSMVTKYIVKGVYGSEDLKLQDGLMLSGIKYDFQMNARINQPSASGYVSGGPEGIVYSNTKQSQFVRNWSPSLTGSINTRTANGMVHVLEQKHIFGFDEFVYRLTYVPPPPDIMLLVGGILTAERYNPGGENADKVWDNNALTKFLLFNFNGPVWIQFDCNEPAVATMYSLTSANDAPERDPNNFNLQGSNDGSTWTTLDTRVDDRFDVRFQQKYYRFRNTVAYKYYRLNITKTLNSDLMQLAEWRLFMDK